MKKKLLTVLLSILCALACACSVIACDDDGFNNDNNPDNTTHIHNYDIWNITKEPTCDDDGSHYRVCVDCGYRQEEVIPKINHIYDSDNKCSVCDYKLEYTADLEYEEYTEANNDGATYFAVKGIGQATDSDIVLPAYHEGKAVKKISSWAFSREVTITSVYIANGIETIEQNAFYYCSSMTNITISNSVASIENGVFLGCTSLTNITVENGNTRYHSNGNCLIETQTKVLISGCKNSVIPVGGSVTSIGNFAFDSCYGLTSIKIPNGVISIGNGAFSYCRGLTKIEIPNSVTSIKDFAFYGCSGLLNIEIPNSVTNIGGSAFTGCTSLLSIEIPKSVTNIGNEAFSYCSNLTNLTVANGNTRYHSNGNCLIETQTKVLISGCKNSVIPVGGSVTSIGNFAFDSCINLNNIVIPNSVTSIGDNAFSNCISLTSIVIPNSVTGIGASAFYKCIGLTRIEIPNSIIYFYGWVFSRCSSLTSIIFNGTVAQWNAIKKGTLWYPSIDDYTIIDYTIACTDGTINNAHSNIERIIK